MTALYALTGIYKQALHDLAEMDESLIADTLEGLQGEIKEKAVNVLAYALNMGSDIDQIKQAEQAMATRRKSLEKKREWMMEYLLTNMIRSEITELTANDGSFRARVQQGRESVVIDDEGQIPEEFMRTKIVREPNKTEIAKMLKDGQASWAHLERKPTLKID